MPPIKQGAPMMCIGRVENAQYHSIVVYMEARSPMDVIGNTLEFFFLVSLFVGLRWNFGVSIGSQS